MVYAATLFFYSAAWLPKQAPFLRTSKTNNATIDILSILRYLQNNGWMGNVTVGQVQYGFEITSSSGGMNFGSHNFSVTAY